MTNALPCDIKFALETVRDMHTAETQKQAALTALGDALKASDADPDDYALKVKVIKVAYVFAREQRNAQRTAESVDLGWWNWRPLADELIEAKPCADVVAAEFKK